MALASLCDIEGFLSVVQSKSLEYYFVKGEAISDVVFAVVKRKPKEPVDNKGESW